MRSSFLLTLAALIWGTTFVAQSSGMEYVGGFTFIAVRFFIGGIVLIPVIIFLQNGNKTYQNISLNEHIKHWRKDLKGGVCCGVALFVGSALQQFGIAFTTVGKAGFITALYIIMVPLLGVFIKKKISWNVWISVCIAAVGMYLLCITESLTVGMGDLLVFFCAIAFAVHILVVDGCSAKGNGFVISCVQFFTASILAGAGMFLFETPTWSAILSAAIPILYAGVFSSGVAFTLQVVAQRDLEPTVASLLMSLESVFSLLAGWILLGQKMSSRELVGAILVFGAIILAQIPIEFFKIDIRKEK